MVHQYLITEAVKELEERDSELPVVRDPWSCSYVRQKLNGLLGGPYENKGIKSVHHEGVPWSFDHDLLDADLDHIAPSLEMMVERMPLTSFAKFKVAGSDAETLLNRLYANRMPAKAGGITLAHQLTDGGFIESEATITRLGADRFYILAAGSALNRDFDMLNNG